uniref:Uncharacterized protein n=1 Tax=Trichuris muris TaxID=70415 RepID=A0A5S6QD56_TRIMR
MLMLETKHAAHDCCFRKNTQLGNVISIVRRWQPQSIISMASPLGTHAFANIRSPPVDRCGHRAALGIAPSAADLHNAVRPPAANKGIRRSRSQLEGTRSEHSRSVEQLLARCCSSSILLRRRRQPGGAGMFGFGAGGQLPNGEEVGKGGVLLTRAQPAFKLRFAKANCPGGGSPLRDWKAPPPRPELPNMEDPFPTLMGKLQKEQGNENP